MGPEFTAVNEAARTIAFDNGESVTFTDVTGFVVGNTALRLKTSEGYVLAQLDRILYQVIDGAIVK